MKKYLTQENIICVIVILFTIMITNNTLMFGTNANDIFNQITLYLSCLAGILLCVYTVFRQKKISLVRFVIAVSLFLLILLSALINADLRMGYIYKIALVLFSWAAVEFVGFKKFAVSYDVVMTFLASASLILTGIYLIWPQLFSSLPHFKNLADLNFYHFGISAIPTFYYDFPRNFGIFREPGVYQMYLILAMLFQLTVFKKTNYWKLAIYAITVVTTLSTVGYLALILIFILFLFRIKDRISKKTWIIVFSSIGGIILVALLIPNVSATLYNILISKWNIHGSSGASSISRYASIVINLLLTVKHPIFGAGITNVTQSFPLLSEHYFGYASTSNTNTLLINFAVHGIIFGLVWLFGYFKGAYSLGKDLKEKIIIALIILILSMSQNYSYSFISYLLLFYSFTAKKVPQKLQPLQLKKEIDNPLYLAVKNKKQGKD